MGTEARLVTSVDIPGVGDLGKNEAAIDANEMIGFTDNTQLENYIFNRRSSEPGSSII